MSQEPVHKALDPFIEKVAGRTAALVLGSLKPQLLNEAAIIGHNNPPAAIDDVKPADKSADDEVYTVAQFCARYKISRSTLYEEWRNGTGPRFFKVGAATRITNLAGRQWVREREAASLTDPAE